MSMRNEDTKEKLDLKLITPTKYRNKQSKGKKKKKSSLVSILENGIDNNSTGKEDYMGELSLRASPTLENYDLTNCYLCNKSFTTENDNEILMHMSRHYKLELQINFIERPESTWKKNNKCPKCDEYVESEEEFVMHIGVIHQQVLQYIPERLKNTFLRSKVKTNSDFLCPLEHCDRNCDTRQKLLLHLLMNHYEQKLTEEFGKSFEKNNGQCLICDRKLPLNKTGYLKHIGVEHELVIEYLEKDTSVRYIPLEIYQKPIINENSRTMESRAPNLLSNLNTFVEENIPVTDIRSCLDSDSE